MLHVLRVHFRCVVPARAPGAPPSGQQALTKYDGGAGNDFAGIVAIGLLLRQSPNPGMTAVCLRRSSLLPPSGLSEERDRKVVVDHQRDRHEGGVSIHMAGNLIEKSAGISCP
jgi:hypothetical protein